MIANFVILILLVEIGTRVSFIYQSRCLLYVLVKLLHYSSCAAVLSAPCHTTGIMCYLNTALKIVTQESYIPILCVFVKVLWLVYLRSPYKYTVKKWIAYIVMKIIAVFIIDYIVSTTSKIIYSVDYNDESSSAMLQCFFMIFEFINFLVYSRRFYLLLKGIEIENKLSIDRGKYLECRFIRIHFKVCTILVAIAFLCRIISGLSVARVFAVQSTIFNIYPDIQLNPELKIILQNTDAIRIQLLYRLFSNLNYLYMFCVILLQYCKRRNNRNINDRIRPLVRAYQDKIFKRRDYYRNS